MGRLRRQGQRKKHVQLTIKQRLGRYEVGRMPSGKRDKISCVPLSEHRCRVNKSFLHDAVVRRPTFSVI